MGANSVSTARQTGPGGQVAPAGRRMRSARGGLLFHQLSGNDDPEGEETDKGGGGGNGNHSGNPRSWGVGAARRIGRPGKIAMRVVSGAGVTPDFRLCKIFIAYYPKKLPPHNNPGGAIRGAVRGAAPTVGGVAPGGSGAARDFSVAGLLLLPPARQWGLGGGAAVPALAGGRLARTRRPGLARGLLAEQLLGQHHPEAEESDESGGGDGDNH